MHCKSKFWSPFLLKVLLAYRNMNRSSDIVIATARVYFGAETKEIHFIYINSFMKHLFVSKVRKLSVRKQGQPSSVSAVGVKGFAQGPIDNMITLSHRLQTHGLLVTDTDP